MSNVGLRIIRQAHHKWFDGVYTELCRSAHHRFRMADFRSWI